MSKVDADVVIVGAGPTGLILACRLILLGKTVIILEKEPVLPLAVRALGYYGATQYSLRNAGVFEEASKRGFFQGSFSWRKLTKQVAPDEKAWGDLIADWNPWQSSGLELGQCGCGMLTLGQDRLRDICMEKLKKSPLATVHLGYSIAGLEQHDDHAVVIAEDSEGNRRQFSGLFVAGADGSKSGTRKLVGQTLEGFTWPKALIGADLMANIEPPKEGSALSYILDTKDVGFFCPLERPQEGKKTLWRFTLPMLPEECEPGVFDENFRAKLETFVPGKRPLDIEVINVQQYRTHQRQVADYLVGRTILVGDAAHLNSPTGGLGLTTGLLDADSLADALDLVLNQGKDMSVLRAWADERHRVWKEIVSPMSSENQTRFYNTDPDQALADPFLKMVIEKSPALEEVDRAFDKEMVTRIKDLVKV